MKLGSHMTDEQRALDSARMTGHVKTPAMLAKIAAQVGHPWACLAASIVAHTGSHPSLESLARQSAAMMGHIIAPETRAAISKTLKDKKGGVSTEVHLIRTSVGYDVWRTAVFTRDDFVCCSCGKRGGKLVAHHLDSFADVPEKRLDVDNGVTFCGDCHDAFHRGYGRRHNRKWQTDEFLYGGLDD